MNLGNNKFPRCYVYFGITVNQVASANRCPDVHNTINAYGTEDLFINNISAIKPAPYHLCGREGQSYQLLLRLKLLDLHLNSRHADPFQKTARERGLVGHKTDNSSCTRLYFVPYLCPCASICTYTPALSFLVHMLHFATTKTDCLVFIFD